MDRYLLHRCVEVNTGVVFIQVVRGYTGVFIQTGMLVKFQ